MIDPYYGPYIFLPIDSNLEMRNDNSYFTPIESLMYGNLFKSEYIPYKNYQPVNLKSDSQKDSLLLQIQSYTSTKLDLVYLLDIYPEKKEYLKMLKEYDTKLKKLIEEYEKNYGSLYA